MNTSSLLQSYFSRDRKYTWFHENFKNWIHFLINISDSNKQILPLPYVFLVRIKEKFNPLTVNINI